MPISAVGSASYPQVTLPTAATKPADTDASKPAAPAAAAASSSSTPSAKESASSDHDKDESSASSSNVLKINPDGTVGPLHHRRLANSPGVIHA